MPNRGGVISRVKCATLTLCQRRRHLLMYKYLITFTMCFRKVSHVRCFVRTFCEVLGESRKYKLSHKQNQTEFSKLFTKLDMVTPVIFEHEKK